MQLLKKFFVRSFQKIFCLWLSKKYLDSKSHFHSLVMNSPLLIKCSYEKIFVANFAFFNNYNIFFIKLQVKNQAPGSVQICPALGGPLMFRKKNCFCFGRKEVKIKVHFCKQKKRIWGWVRKVGLGLWKQSWTARRRIIPYFNQFVK